MKRDLGLFALRATVGGLLIGHGAQKLFGTFEGHGIQGTGQFFEQLGLHPGERWALTAGLGESAGGALTALGLAWPIGPIASLAPMVVAWRRAHWGKPIWVTSGGGELPLTNIAIGTALALTGPGRYSIDRMLGIRVHPAIAALATAGIAAGTLMALTQPTTAPAPEPTPEASPRAENAI